MNQTEEMSPQSPSVQFCMAWGVSSGKTIRLAGPGPTEDSLPAVLNPWVATPRAKGPSENTDIYTTIHSSCKITVMMKIIGGWGLTTAKGTVLKSFNIRKVENQWSKRLAGLGCRQERSAWCCLEKVDANERSFLFPSKR